MGRDFGDVAVGGVWRFVAGALAAIEDLAVQIGVGGAAGFPAVMIADELLSVQEGVASELGIAEDLCHGGGEAADGLWWGIGGYLDAGVGGDLGRRSAEIEADDGSPGGHGFDADPAAGIMEAGMDKGDGLLEFGEGMLSREVSPETDAVADAEAGGEPGEATAFGAVADDPVLGILEAGKGEGFDAEMESFPADESAEADEGWRVAERDGACKGGDVVVGERHFGTEAYALCPEDGEASGGFGGGCLGEGAASGGEANEGIGFSQ